MREHVPSDARIHYVITNGGKAPNVVPDFAEVYYYARHNDMRVLDGIWERIVNAASGAALGTGTTMELEMTGAVWNVLPNSYLVGADAEEPADASAASSTRRPSGSLPRCCASRSTATCRRSTARTRCSRRSQASAARRPISAT